MTTKGGTSSWQPRSAGAVLLEVVLALGLFVSAAAVIGGSVNMAILADRNVRTQVQAADLAVTKLSEMQMGLLTVVDSGPNSYTEDERLPDWTWQVVTTPLENATLLQGTPLKRVEIIVRHTPSGYTRRLVHVLPARDDSAGADASPDATSGGGG